MIFFEGWFSEVTGISPFHEFYSARDRYFSKFSCSRVGLQPPGPNEAGPSNWIERNLQIVDMQAQEVVHMTHQAGNFLPLNRTQAPPDFRHVNPSSNERFQTVPTITRIATNQSVQVSHEDGNNIELTQEGEPYSPTSPLLLHLHDTDSDIVDEMGDEEVTEAPRLRLGLQCTSAMFPGKRRRNGDHARAQSANSFFMFIGNENQVRKKKRQKRYEEWDAKGGFIMRRNPSSDSFFAKTITDVSMAQRHFHSLLTSNGGEGGVNGDEMAAATTDDHSEAIDLVLRELNMPTLSSIDSEMLMQPLTSEEVKNALFSLADEMVAFGCYKPPIMKKKVK
ncbi:hypothetical protein BVRB_3g058840 [Beta vulgaris subsp. vulgaris]|nr:hypothetical protein BVRB_3g058840 [Beta vulgaris subsp. vulgaris]